MKVNVLFFGAAREAVGSGEIELSLPDKINAAGAFQAVLQKYPELSVKFGKSLLFAINQSYANGDETIANDDELAVFPPVSGG